MNISDFTKKEIDYLLEECNFTQLQTEFFLLRAKGINIETSAEAMNVSVSCANALSKKIKGKIQRVLKEKEGM